MEGGSFKARIVDESDDEQDQLRERSLGLLNIEERAGE